MKIYCFKPIIMAISCLFVFNAYSQERILIADYPLVEDLVDSTGTQFDAFLAGSPSSAPPGNGVELCQDGIWSNKNGILATQSLYTPVLKGFDLDNFEVEIEFKPTAFSRPEDVSPFKAVIMGGHLARWIGLLIDNTGRVGFKFNNFNTNITWTNTVLTIDQLYHHVRIVYDYGDAMMYIDDQLVFTDTLPPLIDFQSDHLFITSDNSTGSPFYGCIKNLKVNSTSLVFKSSFE